MNIDDSVYYSTKYAFYATQMNLYCAICPIIQSQVSTQTNIEVWKDAQPAFRPNRGIITTIDRDIK